MPLKGNRRRKRCLFRWELAVQVPCLLRCKTHTAGEFLPSSAACTVGERSHLCKPFEEFRFSLISPSFFSRVPSIFRNSGTVRYGGGNSFECCNHSTVKNGKKCTLRSYQGNQAPLLRPRHCFLSLLVFVRAVSAQTAINRQGDCTLPFPSERWI